MPLDPSISLAYKPPEFDNPVNQLAKVLQVQGLQSQNALAQYNINKAQRQDEETNRLAQLLSNGGADLSTPEGQAKAYSVAPTMAGSYIKNQLDQRKTVSDIGKTDAEAQSKTVDAAHQRIQTIGQGWGYVRANPTPEAANQVIDSQVALGLLQAPQAQQLKATIAQNPAQIGALADQLFQGALAAKDQLSQYQTRNTGAQTQTLAIDPVTGKVDVASSVQNTVSPDAALQAQTSRANNRDTIAAENVRAGVGPGGGLDDNAERTAQAIANGQLPAPTGMALLNPKNQRILGRVMEINPQYDASTVSAKKAAATAFTSGNQGNAMRSFAVAGQHLDQLGQLVDALDNGNMQLVNKIGNFYSQQTGSPAVTNFDAAKDVVSKEVVKAIVAGGGGVAEREELSKLMSNAKSPAQLKGVINQYRSLMGAQHDALLQQRRAAGLPDSTLPNYTDANGSTNANPVTSAIDAELARRGGK